MLCARKNRPMHAAFCMRMQARSCACIAKSRNLNKTSFLHLCWGLEWIPHHLGVIPNPYFHTISSLTWYIFKTYRNLRGKHQDSPEIVNQRGTFSQKILKSIFFWLGPFLALIFKFKITNHSFIELWIYLNEGNGKKSSLKGFCLRY